MGLQSIFVEPLYAILLVDDKVDTFAKLEEATMLNLAAAKIELSTKIAEDERLATVPNAVKLDTELRCSMARLTTEAVLVTELEDVK